MKQEDINKAAEEYSASFIEDDISRAENRAFIAGAEWRINSAWHPATERPKDGEYLTILHDKGNIVAEIAPWRNGKYQGVYYTGVYFGFVKVIKYANIYHLLPRETEQ